MKRQRRVGGRYKVLLCAFIVLTLALSSFYALADSETTTVAGADKVKMSVGRFMDVLDEEDIDGITSLYWPWVVDTQGKIESPLGKYYMYFSVTDSDGKGYISMAYSDEPASGWTYYGHVYTDMDGDNEYTCSAPSVIWIEENRELIMYYQSDNSYAGERQSAWLVRSGDGITWSGRKKMLDLDSARVFGNTRNGQTSPFEYNGTRFAYSNLGGGSVGCALSWSEDGGVTWTTDHRQISRWNVEGNEYIYPNRGCVVRMMDEYWWVGIMTDSTPGVAEYNGRIVMSRMDDLRCLTGRAYVLREITDDDFEGDGINSLSAFVKDETLYIYYNCSASQYGTDDDKDFVNCLIVKRDETYADEDGIPKDVIRITEQPQDVTVGFGKDARLICEARTANNDAINYQWLDAKTGEPIPNATEPELFFEKPERGDARTYVCEVSAQGYKSIKSRPAKIAVEPEIIITVQPEDVKITQGESTRLTCVAETNTGEEVAYQWLNGRNQSVVRNATQSEFEVPTNRPVGETTYYCRVTCSNTSVLSRLVTVFVEELAPVVNVEGDGDGGSAKVLMITTQPEDKTIELETGDGIQCIGTTLDGTPVTYQWRYADSGGAVRGQTESAFIIPDDTKPGDYTYNCEVGAEGYQSILSRTATIRVVPSTVPKLSFVLAPESMSVTQGNINQSLSVRAECSDGGDVAYQWYSNTSNRNSRGEAIEGETGEKFDIPTDLAAGTYYYYCTATNPKAVEITTDAVVVLVLVNTDAGKDEDAQSQGANDISLTDGAANKSFAEFYRRGKTIYSLEETASFFSRASYDKIISDSIGLNGQMYLQQYRFDNAEYQNGKYAGGFDTIPVIMNDGERDVVTACEVKLDGMWFSKSPDELSVTFTDGTNYVKFFSSDKRASDSPTNTRFEALINGELTTGAVAQEHNIIAQPSVLYSPRFRIDKSHSEISLWVADQLLERAHIEGLSALGEIKVELRFNSDKQNDVSMFVSQIALRLDC